MHAQDIRVKGFPPKGLMRNVGSARINAGRVGRKVVARRWLEAPRHLSLAARGEGRALVSAGFPDYGGQRSARVVLVRVSPILCPRWSLSVAADASIFVKKEPTGAMAQVEAVKSKAVSCISITSAAGAASYGFLLPQQEQTNAQIVGGGRAKATFMQHCDEMWRSNVFGALLRGLQLISFAM